jgi:hypothetical protein
VTKEKLIDSTIEFRPTNFQQGISHTGVFDLAISVEVVEHLPSDAADRLVQSIAQSANAVVFGAAFIGQPGLGHINTRPHSYWAHKFVSNGYLLFDIFRPEFWSDNRVEPLVSAKHFSLCQDWTSTLRGFDFRRPPPRARR